VRYRLRYHAYTTSQPRGYHTFDAFTHFCHANASRLVTILSLQPIYSLIAADFAELNAPPMINYGVVYPQSILIFTVIMLYSVVQPLIVIFGAIYFGVAYVVYKYKLLFGSFIHPQAFNRSSLFNVHLQYSTNHMNPKAKPGPSHSSVSSGGWSFSLSL
jgi:hypothetical protein